MKLELHIDSLYQGGGKWIDALLLIGSGDSSVSRHPMVSWYSLVARTSSAYLTARAGQVGLFDKQNFVSRHRSRRVVLCNVRVLRAIW